MLMRVTHTHDKTPQHKTDGRCTRHNHVQMCLIDFSNVITFMCRETYTHLKKMKYVSERQRASVLPS